MKTHSILISGGFCLTVFSCLGVTAAAAQASTPTTSTAPAYPAFPTPVPAPSIDANRFRYDTIHGKPLFDPANDDADQPYASDYRLYFPAIPPVLAEMPSPTHLMKLPTRYRYPTEVEGFVGEVFYLPYKGLLLENHVLAKSAQRVATYQASRDQLLTALRSRLEELKDMAGAPRAAALAEFAARQADPLRNLALEEEALREDFTTRSFLKRTVYETNTTVYLPDASGAHPLELDPIPQAAIKAAQLQAGLSIPQRLLLEETAIEQELTSQDKAQPDPYVFFWPATARIRLPDALPAATAAQFAEFARLKNSLKSELLAAVVPAQNGMSLDQRTQTYARLAEEQAGRFAALDTLAEEIRPGLAGVPYPDEPAQPNLPADLTHRVGDAIARKAVLSRELVNRLKEFRHELPADKIELVPKGAALAIAITPVKSTPAADRPARDNAIARLQALNSDYSRRFAALAAEINTLRTEIQRVHDTSDRAGSLDVEQVATDFEKSYEVRRNWDRFHDYYVAVIQPGLSPEQRRLLFNGALVDLETEKIKASN